ncbi:MAG: arylamine N-acetyltransferase [Vicinamibacterales bacterium]
MADDFPLNAYLSRLGWSGPVRPDLATLRALHRAHVGAIPFENLDIQMGRPIGIDPASLQAALVDRRRGGYCFQQNGLFRLALTAIGYEPRGCEGRVRLEATGIRPRTHMVLTLALENRRWLADVGFGANGLVEPVPLDGTESAQDGWRYRVAADGRFHVLQRAGTAAWEDLYVFSDEEVPQIDYIAGNWFTSTYPESGFVRSLTVQRTIAGRRHLLRNLTYAVAEDGAWVTREIRREELVPLLRDTFGLDVPDDARFVAIDAPGTGTSA